MENLNPNIYLVKSIREMDKMKEQIVIDIIKEEIENVKWGNVPFNEELESKDLKLIRHIIRTEVSAIFFDLFKKRKSWGA